MTTSATLTAPASKTLADLFASASKLEECPRGMPLVVIPDAMVTECEKVTGKNAKGDYSFVKCELAAKGRTFSMQIEEDQMKDFPEGADLNVVCIYKKNYKDQYDYSPVAYAPA